MKSTAITLLTDFGTADHYAAAMKGVILGIAPDARITDITHEIRPYAITEAAYTLAQAWTCFPEGTVHLVVVDPGVGSARRPIVAETAGHYFVAPDNGVLTLVLENARVHEVTSSRLFRQPVSRTFHGRDIFAPVAAHLANGVAVDEMGPRVENYARLDIASPVQTASGWRGRILKVDRFGNLITNFQSDQWLPRIARGFEMTLGQARVSRVVSKVVSNYADAGEGLFVIPGSAGFLEVSARQTSAARIAGIESGDVVELRAAL
ncbi:MAG TPA: SAM-dependent chlorinase/fluorinase [Bryobacteraceae bacterium]|nr:SAM-dependent chlorinase/fluorinase [Bryobacteraceae bacterium]